MCSFVHANVTLGSAVVLPAKGSTRLQSCVLHIAGGAATVYVPEGSSDGGKGDGAESPSADDGLDGSIGDAEVVIAN